MYPYGNYGQPYSGYSNNQNSSSSNSTNNNSSFVNRNESKSTVISFGSGNNISGFVLGDGNVSNTYNYDRQPAKVQPLVLQPSVAPQPQTLVHSYETSREYASTQVNTSSQASASSSPAK